MRPKTNKEGASKHIPISDRFNKVIMDSQEKHQLKRVISKSVNRRGNVCNRLYSGSIGTILNGQKTNLEYDICECRFSGHSFRAEALIDLLEADALLETILLKDRWLTEENALNYQRNWCFL